MLDYIIMIATLIIAVNALILGLMCNRKINALINALLKRQVEINEGIIKTLEGIISINSKIVKNMKEQANEETKKY